MTQTAWTVTTRTLLSKISPVTLPLYDQAELISLNLSFILILSCVCQTCRRVYSGGSGAHHSGEADPAAVTLHRPVQASAAPSEGEKEEIPAQPQGGARNPR